LIKRHDDRFTPTRVGNSLHNLLIAVWRAVHPHTRGEFIRACNKSLLAAGSPPHAWGILQFHLQGNLSSRFTPTRVGNSSGSADRLTVSSVHPHTRGEFLGGRIFADNISGSPPHAWGIRKNENNRCNIFGFTPTRVGNSILHPNHYRLTPVHPHTRGEFINILKKEGAWIGSPPHAWGIRCNSIFAQLDIRFTPTRVGNSCAVSVTGAVPPVHPHTRGEFVIQLLIASVIIGSPPHAWGILQFDRLLSIFTRFTPTRVGNSVNPAILSIVPPVHPHTRGEFHLFFCLHIDDIGSPPHAWGILAYSSIRATRARFTPTRVGNS